MTEDDPTKDLTDEMTDRQILLELRQAMAAMTERMAELERRTNPLPPNYDARFTAMEDRLARMESEMREMRVELRRHGHKLDELAINALDVKAAQRELSERVDALESRPN